MSGPSEKGICVSLGGSKKCKKEARRSESGKHVTKKGEDKEKGEGWGGKGGGGGVWGGGGGGGGRGGK